MGFYDRSGRYHHVDTDGFKAYMAHHLKDDHGMSIRQINIRLGLTDLEVRYLLGDKL